MWGGGGGGAGGGGVLWFHSQPLGDSARLLVIARRHQCRGGGGE